MLSSRLEQTHFIIGELLGFFKYASFDYAIRCANEGVSLETQKANEYARILIKIWDYLEALDSATIESIELELDGLILGMKKNDKRRRQDLKAVRTIIHEYLTIDEWGIVNEIVS